ncbi:hypothetical protein D9758_003138 [Tetrapyrgos nigripes]|uniref:Glycosyltransferase family 8 protein n=1 Tax=Tetrapyrgos nigripes TaxID=182062 RepID=A0A8H5GIV8_9AGAR|nr:hypothetical protein D9758_003138 [Tetrapyrgos nigripes]
MSSDLFSRRSKRFIIPAFALFFLASIIFFRDLPSSFSRDAHFEELSKPLTFDEDYIMTSTLSASPVVHTETVIADRPIEPVVFVLIMWSLSSAIEGSLLMKSVLMYTSSPVEFHIICDPTARVHIEGRLALLTNPRHQVNVFFYEPTYEAMQGRIEREGSIKTDHDSGLPGLMKLLIHEILPPTVKKGIYVDTDAFFISDPTLLWNTFSITKPETAVVLPSHPDQEAEVWNQASRICSCVMLLNLEKLRELRAIDSSIYRKDIDPSHPPSLSPAAFKAMYGVPASGKYDNVKLGDQGYWWAIVQYRKDIWEPLNFDFEVTSCIMNMYNTGLGQDDATLEEEYAKHVYVPNTPQEGHAVLPKLLHFNCLHKTPIYMEWSGWSDPENRLNQDWGAAVRYHDGYKWIWLNQGPKQGSGIAGAPATDHPSVVYPTVQINTMQDVVFADELYARQHGIDY